MADVDDLITNTAGAAIGWAIGMALVRVLPDPDPPPVADTDPPTIRRRIGAGILDVVFLIVIGLVAQFALLIAVRLVIGPDFLDLSWLPNAQIFVGMIVVGFILLLVVPILRNDRATLGQVATWLVPTPVGQLAHPTRRAASIRFAVRWLPVIAAAYFQPILVLGVVFMYETVTAIVRRDNRTLSSVASGTRTVTRRHLDEQAGRPVGPSATD